MSIQIGEFIRDNKRGRATRAAILIAIADHVQRKHFSPTIKELARATGLNSSSTVHKHLERMRREGTIAYEDGHSRTIRIVGDYSYAAKDIALNRKLRKTGEDYDISSQLNAATYAKQSSTEAAA